MLSKDVLARVNALKNLREQFGDNLVDRFVAQFGFNLEEHCTHGGKGRVFRCLSEEDHDVLCGVNNIRDGYTGWYSNESVATFASHCKDEILLELEEESFNTDEDVGSLLSTICGHDKIIYELIEDCLDRNLEYTESAAMGVNACLGYWIGGRLVLSYQDFYYQETNNG